MMWRGVPAGARRPNQVSTSKPGSPDSATVGNSAALATRCALVTATPRSLPLRACGNATGRFANMNEVCPARRSVMAGASDALGELLRHYARGNIGAAACSEADYDAH